MDRTDDDRDPIEKFKAINQELSTYDNKLLKLPQLLWLQKWILLVQKTNS